MPRTLAYWGLGVLLLIALGVGSYFWQKQRTIIRRDARQAVFLTNGQIYFGRVTSLSSDFITMEQVYYPQNRDSLQPDSSGTRRKITLQKLGDEIYGPYDRISVNREHVLYIENMRDDSRINEAINQYQEEKKALTASPSAPSSPSPSP